MTLERKGSTDMRRHTERMRCEATGCEPATTKDVARLTSLYHQIADACNAGDLHGAKRLNVQARVLVRKVYGDPLIVQRANGGR